MQPPTSILQAVMAMTVWLSRVNAPGVKRRTELYTSHKELSISIDRTCDNIFLIDEKPYARVNDQSIPMIEDPFNLDGDKIVVSRDVNFLHRILCAEPNNLETEYRIHYTQKPSDKNATAPTQGSLASVFLALTLAVVIVMCG